MSLEVSRPAETAAASTGFSFAGAPFARAGASRVLAVLSVPAVPGDPAALEPALDRALAALAAQTGEPADVVLVVDDPGQGPGAAVNAALQAATPDHLYACWLGVDDELLPGALEVAASRLDAVPEAVLAFGDCRFVTGDGEYLCTSHTAPPSRWRLLTGAGGPVPAAALIRLSAWRAAGGLDVSLHHAMSLDLLLRLRRRGPFVATGRTLAVHHRAAAPRRADVDAALAEVSAIRRRHLPGALRPVARVLEVPLRLAGRRAPAVTRRAGA